VCACVCWRVCARTQKRADCARAQKDASSKAWAQRVYLHVLVVAMQGPLGLVRRGSHRNARKSSQCKEFVTMLVHLVYPDKEDDHLPWKMMIIVASRIMIAKVISTGTRVWDFVIFLFVECFITNFLHTHGLIDWLPLLALEESAIQTYEGVTLHVCYGRRWVGRIRKIDSSGSLCLFKIIGYQHTVLHWM